MISDGFRFACVAPVCGLVCSSEAVMGLRVVRNSAGVLCGLRAGRDSDGAPHNLRAGLLSGGAFVWRAAPCAFNGAFAIRKLSVRRFFPHCSVPLSCRFVFDFLSKRRVTFPRVALC